MEAGGVCGSRWGMETRRLVGNRVLWRLGLQKCDAGRGKDRVLARGHGSRHLQEAGQEHTQEGGAEDRACHVQREDEHSITHADTRPSTIQIQLLLEFSGLAEIFRLATSSPAQ
eukprot:4263486-Pleurochrysis_carterae.AAC.2